jgi:predicted RNA methylase
MVIHNWRVFRNLKNADLSEQRLLNSIVFSRKMPDLSDQAVRLPICKDGVANALWLSSRAHLAEDDYLQSTNSLNPPVAIPIRPRQVSSGKEIGIRVKYMFGHGYQNFSADFD